MTNLIYKLELDKIKEAKTYKLKTELARQHRSNLDKIIKDEGIYTLYSNSNPMQKPLIEYIRLIKLYYYATAISEGAASRLPDAVMYLTKQNRTQNMIMNVLFGKKKHHTDPEKTPYEILVFAMEFCSEVTFSSAYEEILNEKKNHNHGKKESLLYKMAESIGTNPLPFHIDYDSKTLENQNSTESRIFSSNTDEYYEGQKRAITRVAICQSIKQRLGVEHNTLCDEMIRRDLDPEIWEGKENLDYLREIQQQNHDSRIAIDKTIEMAEAAIK